MKTKNYIWLLLLLSATFEAEAQTSADIKSGTKAVAAATTAAQQDILSNYLQIAAQGVTSSGSGLQLKLNWFSINSDPDKYDQRHYNKTYWERNGEFIGFYGTKSWQAGLTFNFLNLSDTTRTNYIAAYGAIQDQEISIVSTAIANLKLKVLPLVQTPLQQLVTSLYESGQPVNDLKMQIDAKLPGVLQDQNLYAQLVQVLQDSLNAGIAKHTAGNNIPPDLQKLVDQTSGILTNQAISTLVKQYGNGQLNGNPFSTIITSQQLDDLKKLLDDHVKNNPLISQTLVTSTWPEAYSNLQKKYEDLIKEVARKPLLTFGYLYNHQIGTGAPSHDFGLTFLKNFGKVNSAYIGQLKASLTDTLDSNDPAAKTGNLGRNIIAFQAGYNQVLFVYNKASMAEINGALEEDRATDGYIANHRDE